MKTTQHALVTLRTAVALLAVSTTLRAQSFYVSTSGPDLNKVSAPSTVTTFATLPGNATSEGLAFDASGNLYAADGVGSQVFKIAPGGTVTLFATLPIHPSGLAFDASGNLFAVGADSNQGAQLDKISPAGVVTLFSTLPGGTSPQGLAFANGNFYITDNGNTSQILVVTPGGAASMFSTLPANSSPLGLAADSSGNLYSADASIAQISKIAPNGVVTVFATLPEGSFPFGLTFDGSGNLYSANSGGGTISKIAPDGTVTTFATGVTAPEYIILAPAAGPAALANISTRLQVGTGDNVLIGGFIVQGSVSKKVIVRGIGPSLTAKNVPGALVDPTLELRGADGALLASNDNWKTTVISGILAADQAADIQSSGLAPTDDRESALIATLAPGNYTAIIRGKTDTTGIGLAEVFDLDQAASVKLANISTRGIVQTGDQVMIGGFIVASQPVKVLVRATGPSLTAKGVPNALPDTTLDLVDSNGTAVASNDDWQSNQAAEITAANLQPSDSREAAVLKTLAPGNYTAIVRGKNNATGVGLVEVYNLN